MRQVTDGKLLHRCGKTTACGRASQRCGLLAGLLAEEYHRLSPAPPSGHSAPTLSILHFLLGLTCRHIEGRACLSSGEHFALYPTSVPHYVMMEHGRNYLPLSGFHCRPCCHLFTGPMVTDLPKLRCLSLYLHLFLHP